MFRDKKIIVISLILGLAAGGVYYLYSGGMIPIGKKQAEKPAPPVVKTITCVVAATDVARRTKLTSEMLSTIELPEETVHPQAVTDVKKAVGRITADRLVKGQALLEPNLRSQDAPSELGFVLPRGMRAITIGATVTTGVGNMLRPGDYVDVIVYLNSQIAENDVSFTLLRKVLVLATDTRLEGEEEESGPMSKVAGPVQNAKGYDSITLAGSPQDCVKLNLAESIGKLKLVLHAPSDTAVVRQARELADPAGLASEYGFAVAGKQGAPSAAPVDRNVGASENAVAKTDRVAETQRDREAAAAKPRVVYIMRGSELHSMTALRSEDEKLVYGKGEK